MLMLLHCLERCSYFVECCEFPNVRTICILVALLAKRLFIFRVKVVSQKQINKTVVLEKIPYHYPPSMFCTCLPKNIYCKQHSRKTRIYLLHLYLVAPVLSHFVQCHFCNNLLNVGWCRYRTRTTSFPLGDEWTSHRLI